MIMKHTKKIAVLLAAILSMASFAACGSTKSNKNQLCTFEFHNNDDVIISAFHEHSYFTVESAEDPFDSDNLEFISENPKVASFLYDSTALSDYIYYNIEPISWGETDVYVKCKQCGAESEKLHVIVDLPKTTTSPSVPKAENKTTKAETSKATDPSESVQGENSDTPAPNTTEMVDAIYYEAKADSENASTEQLQEAVDFLRNHTTEYFSGNENMEKTMYYGELLECYYKGTNNEYEKIGWQAFKTIKYVYRGVDQILDEVTQNNLKELQDMAQSLSDIPQ